MPLPVAHSLAGAAVHAGLDADGGVAAWKRLALAAFIANAPDLDMIPGLLVGDPNRWHHGATHSAAAVLIAALIAAVVAAAGWRWPLRHGRGGVGGTALVVGVLWLSHVVLDAFTQDLSEPVGVPLSWPLSERHFLLYGWFPYVDKLGGEGSPLDFVASLMSAHNVWAMAVEAATMLPILIAVVWWRHKRAGRSRG